MNLWGHTVYVKMMQRVTYYGHTHTHTATLGKGMSFLNVAGAGNGYVMT